jgi:hypothetical protein
MMVLPASVHGWWEKPNKGTKKFGERTWLAWRQGRKELGGRKGGRKGGGQDKEMSIPGKWGGAG